MEPWLELRSGAPGLDGPFLLEHPQAYQVLDEQTERPDVFLAIGGKTKRRFLQKLRAGPSAEHDGVVLEELLSSTVLLDCELHDATLPRIKAGPRKEGCTNSHHLLKAAISDSSAPQDVAKYVFEFVWQALIPFTSTVVIFLDDIGGLRQLSDILATWSTRPIQSEPRIVILHDASLKVNQERFQTLVWRKLGAHLLHVDPLHLPTRQKIPFESVHFLPINESALVEVLAHVDRSASLRQKCGLAFRSEHIKDLVQQSIAQFAAGEPAPFDFYLTARRRNPIPKDLVRNVAHFLDISRNLRFDRPSIIASALVMDALPPGMHTFPPGSMYDHFYSESLASVDRLLDASLSAAVRTQFIQLCEERAGQSTAQQHLSFIGNQKGLWKKCRSTEICFVCLGRPPRRRLSCGHRFCDTCVVICELVTLSNANWPKKYCPLCHEENYVDIVLRPATAGVRALEVRGPVQSKENMLDFLRQLQYQAGLPLYSLRDQFDLVTGLDAGVYFVQTIFLKEWTVEESGYHLGKVVEPSLTNHSKISFGKGLEWDLDVTRLFNKMDVVLQVKDRLYSNTRVTVQPGENRLSDSTIHCEGDISNAEQMHSITRRMISSLFYIELLELPASYSCPGLVYLRLLCRVPTGLPLVSLLYRLRLNRTMLMYGATTSRYSKGQLVTAGALQRCKEGKYFSRLIKVEVSSHRAKVEVKICTKGSEPQDISNTPYALQDLVRDSRFDCVFGRDDHQIPMRGLPTAEVALEEMERLRETLDGLIGELKDVEYW